MYISFVNTKITGLWWWNNSNN